MMQADPITLGFVADMPAPKDEQTPEEWDITREARPKSVPGAARIISSSYVQ